MTCVGRGGCRLNGPSTLAGFCPEDWMRLYALFGGLLFPVAVVASVQSVPHSWIADTHTGCRVWDMSAAPNDSVPWVNPRRASFDAFFRGVTANTSADWTGGCRGGFAEGRGTLVLRRGRRIVFRFDGAFAEGKPAGKSATLYGNGDRYFGDFHNGSANGQGVSTFANGDRYAGEFRDNKFNGQGVYRFASGDHYEGEFRDGRFNGRGVYSFTSGLRYEGEFRDGKFIPNFARQ